MPLDMVIIKGVWPSLSVLNRLHHFEAVTALDLLNIILHIIIPKKFNKAIKNGLPKNYEIGKY